MDFSLRVSVAVIIEKVVHVLGNAAKGASQSYSATYRDMQKRKLLRIKTENEIRRLTTTDQRVIKEHAEELTGILNVDLELLNERTGSPYKSLKILLSLFRRVRSLALFQRSGKLRLK